MKHWEIVLLLLVLSALPFLRASSSEDYRSNWFFIDCGALNETVIAGTDGQISWDTDQNFIKTGQNRLLSTNQTSIPMNSLRFFADSRKNCYKLPFFTADIKFLFRAGFYYGDYDGLSKPPTFDLEIDGNLWATVTTSLSEEPVYHEVIYKTKGLHATVCLVRTKDGGVPFISSLEAHSLMSNDQYRLMDNNTALYLQSRINYGANQTIEKLIGFQEECCSRIWKSKEMANYRNIAYNLIPYGSMLGENSPPWAVMVYAIQAQNVSDSIYLSVDFSPRTTAEAYFVFYFMDPVIHFTENQTSKVEVYIDGHKMAVTDVPNIGRPTTEYRVVSLYPVPVSGSANVTISPAEGSTLPPILNAMEVFSAINVSKGGHLVTTSLHNLSFSFICFAFLFQLGVDSLLSIIFDT